MKLIKFTSFLVLSQVMGFQPLSAEAAYERLIPIEDRQQLIISQQHLRAFTLGISLYPVSTTIRSYNGTELLVRAYERTTFGFKNPLVIDLEDKEGELRIAMAFKHKWSFGIWMGNMEIELLVPSSWKGNINLEMLKSQTVIENLDISEIRGKTSITELIVEGSRFEKTNFELGADTDLSIYNTDLGECRIRSKLGKIHGEKIRGAIDAETLDGNITISFDTFEGSTRLISKLGEIRAGVPREASTEIDLRSRLGAVKCDVNLASSSELGTKRITGAIGEPDSNNSLILRSGDGKVLLQYRD